MGQPLADQSSAEAAVPKPTIGRIVIYRSRTGAYDVPAIVTCTPETINTAGVEAWRADPTKGVPPLTHPLSVHLTVLTPGIPGQRADAQDFLVDAPHGLIAENSGGTYQEWDITHTCVNCEEAGEEPQPGTWRWPERV